MAFSSSEADNLIILEPSGSEDTLALGDLCLLGTGLPFRASRLSRSQECISSGVTAGESLAYATKGRCEAASVI